MIDCYSGRCVEVGSDSRGIVAHDELFLPVVRIEYQYKALCMFGFDLLPQAPSIHFWHLLADDSIVHQ
jgi:hypothetical protein